MDFGIEECVCSTLFTEKVFMCVESSCVCMCAQAKWIPMSASFVMLGQHPRATGCMQVYELDGADARMVREVERPVRS